MNGEQPVDTRLREVGIDLVPPYPERLTVGGKIQRAWSLLFGLHKEELRPLWCNPAGALGVVPIPLTDMEYVDGGIITVDVERVLAGYADLVIVHGYGQVTYVPQLLGCVGDGEYNYTGYANAMGGGMTDAETEIFPVQCVLNAHVSKIKFANGYGDATTYFHAYRYKTR